MNSIVASSTSIFSCFFFYPITGGKSDPTYKYYMQPFLNSLFAGLIVVSGAAKNIAPWASLVLGILACFCYCVACRLFEKLKIDDPV